MKKISSMTDQQRAQIPAWVKKWVAIGLSTEPANFDEAEIGVRACYSAAKLTQPKLILKLSSPYAIIIGTAMARAIVRSSEQVHKQVHKQVYEQVGEQVREQVREQVGEQVREQVYEQVREQVYEQVREHVYKQVG